MDIQLSVAASYGTRLVARFVVLLVALSIMFDLMGQISVDYLELEGPFEPDKQAFFSAVFLGIQNEDWGAGSLAGLLWHYTPAIVLSLSIAIAWSLVDRRRLAPERLSANGRMNRGPLLLVARLALRFAVLLFVLAALYDLSNPLSQCFNPRSPILPETLPICFRTFFENWILMTRKGGLPGLAWHYLPAAVVATIIMIDWAWTHCRERRK